MVGTMKRKTEEDVVIRTWNLVNNREEDKTEVL